MTELLNDEQTEQRQYVKIPKPTIHERMVKILAELPPIGKDQRNEQQKFMFRGHDDVLNALNPLLSKHGVFVVPDVLERVTDQRSTKGGSIMFEVNLHVRFTFYGAAGDSVSASTWGEGTDMGDKATNKAMTMAFKNVLNQAFAISNKEASDADAETPEESVGQAAPEVAVKQARSYADWQARMLELGVPDAEAWAREAVEKSGIREGKMKRLNEVLTALVIADFDAFSPDPDGQVRAAFSLAFGGVVVDGPPKAPAEPYAEDPGIPFGEGEDA